MKSLRINIAGAGLAGCLIANYLAQEASEVHVYEKRPDPRHTAPRSRRGVNLVLSNNSMHLLEEAGLSGIRTQSVLLTGRMMHSRSGTRLFEPYGSSDGNRLSDLMPFQGGYSISRATLNRALLNAAEDQGVEFHFDCPIKGCEPAIGSLLLADASGGTINVPADALLGCDGTSSVIRQSLATQQGFTQRRPELNYAYKTLCIPPGAAGAFLTEQQALHLWPRPGFIMSALPDPEGFFNCNVFMPARGPNSFESLLNDEDAHRFFAANFQDLALLVPDLAVQFAKHPVNSLAALDCWPWSYGKVLLLGDACHTLYPFSGLGANLALEDCAELIESVQQCFPDLEQAFAAYSVKRRSVIEGHFGRTTLLAPLLLAFLPEEGVAGAL